MPELKAERAFVAAGMRRGRFLRGLSVRTQALRKKAVEGLDFDFKKTVKSLKPGDIVAFANSRGGGVAVCGVEDSTSAVVGCGSSTAKSIDENKMSILGKASNCHPPIPVIVDIENLRRNKPIYVIHIPEMGELCCTHEGLYLKREDGRNVLISPTEIKARVLESEAEEFTRRLEAAARTLEEQMKDIDDQIFELNSTVERYEASLNDIAAEIINDTTGSVEVVLDTMIGDVMVKLDDIEGGLSHENGAIAKYVLRVEKFANALLIALSEKAGVSIDSLLERADADVIRRHSLASQESGGMPIRVMFEKLAADLDKDKSSEGAGKKYIQECLVGNFVIARCPNCRVRDYPFSTDDKRVKMKITSAAPLQIEINCPKCGKTIKHAEEVITNYGW